MKPEDIKAGEYVKIRGSWGYVINVTNELVVVSGWCGKKTSTFNPSMVKEKMTRSEYLAGPGRDR